MDRQAVVWTRAGGAPFRMGSLYVTEREARFQYADGFPPDQAGLSLVYPPRAYRGQPVVFPHAHALHPRLRALIPPADAHNFQRRLLRGLLHAQGQRPMPGFDEDWALLLFAGHGGIGHVDVFADDDSARAWYADPRKPPLIPVGERMGRALKDLMTWTDPEVAALLDSLGPTPSVGGAIPKLLLAMPASGWTGEIAAPGRTADPQRIEIVLKIERPEVYPGIAELEAAALDLHAAAGFAVPRHWRCAIAGLPALAVERFDRDAGGHPRPFETWYSILASGAKDIDSPHAGSLDRIALALDNPSVALVADPHGARRHLYLRLVMALLTGNGDLHLENLALLGHGKSAAFSPVYDPTPMRAYSRHDLLTALPFGGYGDDADLATALERFARALKLKRPESADLIAQGLAVTRDWPERIAALTTLPDAHRRRLAEIHAEMRTRLEK